MEVRQTKNTNNPLDGRACGTGRSHIRWMWIEIGPRKTTTTEEDAVCRWVNMNCHANEVLFERSSSNSRVKNINFMIKE